MEIKSNYGEILSKFKSEKFSQNSQKFEKFLEEIKNDESLKTAPNLDENLKKDAQMFAKFDFMQIINQILYGNLSQSEKDKLMQKAEKIAKEV